LEWQLCLYSNGVSNILPNNQEENYISLKSNLYGNSFADFTPLALKNFNLVDDQTIYKYSFSSKNGGCSKNGCLQKSFFPLPDSHDRLSCPEDKPTTFNNDQNYVLWKNNICFYTPKNHNLNNGKICSFPSGLAFTFFPYNVPAIPQEGSTTLFNLDENYNCYGYFSTNCSPEQCQIDQLNKLKMPDPNQSQSFNCFSSILKSVDIISPPSNPINGPLATINNGLNSLCRWNNMYLNSICLWISYYSLMSVVYVLDPLIITIIIATINLIETFYLFFN
jgi:hypothetical protein